MLPHTVSVLTTINLLTHRKTEAYASVFFMVFFSKSTIESFTMLHLSVVICSLLFSFAAQADVYKWVDADGKTHFGDKVPESANVETLNLPSTPRSSSQPDVSPQEIKQRQQKMLDVFEDSRNAKNTKLAEKLAERKERLRETCNKSASIMSTVRTGSLYTTNKDGSRNYLPESERETVEKRVAQSFKQNCR
jgi:hypothetical protein